MGNTKTHNQLQFIISSLSGFEYKQENVTLNYNGEMITGKIISTGNESFIIKTDIEITLKYVDINIIWNN